MRSLLAAMLLLGCRTPARVAPTVEPHARTPAPVRTPASPAPTHDDLCRADGWDFAYDHPEAAAAGVVECGYGPGTPCDDPKPRCDGRNILMCKWGQTTAANCRDLCQGYDDSGNVHDDGTCGVKNGEATCICCNAGEPGCTTEPKPWRVNPHGGPPGPITIPAPPRASSAPGFTAA